MPFADLREFLSLLKEKGELTYFSNRMEVDSSFEVSAILNILQKKQGPAVIFKRLQDYKLPLCANVLGSFGRIALALETSETDLFSEWTRRKESAWPSPRTVSCSVCSETIAKDDNIDLFRYPALKWNPNDGGRYITLGVVISKDPETNVRNAGIYRLMIQGKRQLGINMVPGRHIGAHYKVAEAAGKSLEVAVAIGVDPAILLAAATDLNLGDDELAFAGALRQEPIKVAKCKSVDIEVPACSEIIIEGSIPPKIRAIEGPFAESTGFYSKAQPMPIINIRVITSRSNPIYQATYSGGSPQEEHFISAFNWSHLGRFSSDFFEKPRSISGIVSSIKGRLKLELSSKRVKLPAHDMKMVWHKWGKYDLG